MLTPDDRIHPVHTVHSRAWWRAEVLHRLALRRLSLRSARRRTPCQWLEVR